MLKLRVRPKLINEMRRDLRRSHPHAAERVGFAFTNLISDHINIILYLPIPDEYYNRDYSVGAHINHKAILMAMRYAAKHKFGILHVHEHGGLGFPHFSSVDLESHGEFLRAFRNGNSAGTHGFLLMSNDKIMARIYKPEHDSYQDIFETTYISWFAALMERLIK